MVKRSVPHVEVTESLFPSPEYVDSQRHVPSALARNDVLLVEYVPLPLTLTVCEYAAVPEQVASLGENSLNVIVPVGLKPPESVKESFGSRFWAVLAFGCSLCTFKVSSVQVLVAPLFLVSPL